MLSRPSSFRFLRNFQTSDVFICFHETPRFEVTHRQHIDFTWRSSPRSVVTSFLTRAQDSRAAGLTRDLWMQLTKGSTSNMVGRSWTLRLDNPLRTWKFIFSISTVVAVEVTKFWGIFLIYFPTSRNTINIHQFEDFFSSYQTRGLLVCGRQTAHRSSQCKFKLFRALFGVRAPRGRAHALARASVAPRTEVVLQQENNFEVFGVRFQKNATHFHFEHLAADTCIFERRQTHIFKSEILIVYFRQDGAFYRNEKLRYWVYSNALPRSAWFQNFFCQ